MRCRVCGTQNPDYRTLCWSCGSSLTPPQASDLVGFSVVMLLSAFGTLTESMANRYVESRVRRIEANLEQAIRALGQARYADALDLAQRSHVADDFPPDYRAWYHFISGQANRGLCNYAQAQTHFQRLLNVTGTSSYFPVPPATQYLLLGLAYYDQWAQDEVGPDARLNRAISSFDNAVQLDSSDAAVLLARGRALTSVDRDNEAFIDFTRGLLASHDESTTAALFAYRSVLLFKRGLQADSRNDAREALKRDPQNELANLVLTKLSSW